MSKKAKAPTLPGPSPMEQALMQSQIDLLNTSSGALKDSLSEINLLAPLLFKETGIRPRMKDGKIIGFDRVKDPKQKLRNQSEKLLLERSIKAAKGELPSDPVLLKELDRQQQQLEDTLRQRLGSGFDVSSAGIEALGDFGANRAMAIGDAGRKDLVTAEGLSLARQSGNQQLIDQVISRALGIAGAPVAPAAAIGQVAQGFANPANNLQQDRHKQFEGQLEAFRANNSGGGIFDALGSLAGLALFAPTGGTSLFATGMTAAKKFF